LKLDVLPRPDDAADALALAICHIHIAATRRRLDLADQPASRLAKGFLV